MFEKYRIKEHMEVTDYEGRHVGTIDAVEGNMMRLTRHDSPDGKHHIIPIDAVEKIENSRVCLKAGTTVSFVGLSPVERVAAAEDTQPVREGEEPLFGTSGHGTGMGGSGVGHN
jgi:hypothetical protein